MHPFEYLQPHTLEEALTVLDRRGEAARVIAGGTALVIMMKQRLVMPEALVSLRRLEHLGAVAAGGGVLRMGSLVTHRQAEVSEQVRRHIPVLAETYAHVATLRVRNMATVGGSLAHADPSQDSPVTLLALGARVRAQSLRGSREIPLERFFTDYYETDLRPGEILTEVEVPVSGPGCGASFMKFLPRTADDYATVAAAAWVEVDRESGACRRCRIAMGGVASTPLRATEAEAVVAGASRSPELLRAAGAAAGGQCDPVSDARGSARYKQEMAAVFVRRALEQAWERAAASAGTG